jgi:hypothetical protein
VIKLSQTDAVKTSARSGDLLKLAIIVGAITTVSAVCATGQERPASNMREVQAHFADCFRPPHDADQSRITFYFSLTRAGQVYGQPRVVWLGFKGSPESRRLFVTDFLKAFNGCLPLPLNEALARTIVGKVYFLQFNIRASSSESTEVILRPYGSHGAPIVPTPLIGGPTQFVQSGTGH